MAKILIGIFILSLSSCAGLLKNRTFVDEMDRQSDPVFVPGQDFGYTAGDSGEHSRSREEVYKRTPMSAQERDRRNYKDSIYEELQFKEKRMHPRDRQVYNSVLPYLDTASEKIYFINLTSDEKIEYANARGIYLNGRSQAARGLASLQPVYDSTLNLGMSKDQVVDRWGRPAKVEVAGDPVRENERWSFFENGKVRQVYFESGTVQGWNLN